MSERAFVIGAGRVGRGLAQAFRAAGIQVLGVHARTPREGASSSGALPRTMSEANVVILAISDAALDAVCHELSVAAKSRGSLVPGTVVLYTSGSVTPSTLPELRKAGSPCGTFHPLAPFASPDRGAAIMRDGWVGIDGDPMACATSRRLAAAIGARTVNIPPGGKSLYHAAAVIASNFPVILAGLAARLLADAGVDPRAAEQVTQRLMASAVANLEHGSAIDVLTGPAVRGDSTTIAAHRAALRNDPEVLAVYDSLTRAVAGLSGGHTPGVHNPDVRRGSKLEG